MPKNPHNFRLSKEAEERLAVLKSKKGWSNTRCVEESLALYAAVVLLEESAVNTLKLSNARQNSVESGLVE